MNPPHLTNRIPGITGRSNGIWVLESKLPTVRLPPTDTSFGHRSIRGRSLINPPSVRWEILVHVAYFRVRGYIGAGRGRIWWRVATVVLGLVHFELLVTRDFNRLGDVSTSFEHMNNHGNLTCKRRRSGGRWNGLSKHEITPRIRYKQGYLTSGGLWIGGRAFGCYELSCQGLVHFVLWVAVVSPKLPCTWSDVVAIFTSSFDNLHGVFISL